MAAGRGVLGSSGSGTRALAQRDRTLPTVSEPSRVVRSIIPMAVSIAQALLVVLIERVPRDAARASQPTWSTPGRPCSQEVRAWFVRRDTPRTSRACAVRSCAVRVVVLTVTTGVYPPVETRARRVRESVRESRCAAAARAGSPRGDRGRDGPA